METTMDAFIDFEIRQNWHKISRLYNQKAAEHGITISIGFILLIIDKEGTPSTQLGPRMGMEPTSLSRTLKTMEDKGLIFRVEDKIDKRKMLVFLTEEGILKRKEAKKVIMNFNEKLMMKISKTKLKVFFDVMSRVDQIVEEELNKMN
jgi:MarR family transcriptional regulator, organic hydroperoxide resistance regulator